MKDIKKATIEELKRELDSRTPYIFSVECFKTFNRFGITPENIEKWFIKNWRRICKNGEGDDLCFWVWRKSDDKFLFGFASKHRRMFYTRDNLKKEGHNLYAYDTTEGDTPKHKITESQMKALRKFGKKYPSWVVARKRLNPK